MSKHIFAVIGGDERQTFLYNMLGQMRAEVISCGTGSGDKESDLKSAIHDSNIIILPLPTTSDGITVNAPFSKEPIYLADIFETARPEQYIFCGNLNHKQKEIARDRGLKIIDYFEREEFSIMNAIPTVEGAIAIAMQNTKYTLFGSRCLVSGFGRIGKILARQLKHLGAEVHVTARKFSDLAWIKAEGFIPEHSNTLAQIVAGYNIIFNTVPALIFDEEVLSKIDSDTLIIDLASAPGGVDFSAAKNFSIETIQALSLPGKVAPKTAAKIIFDTILGILREENL